jgi:acyl-CoA thioesterase YciA
VQLRQGNLQAKFVTVAMNKVEFKQPVLVGDVVRFLTTLIRIGRTSISFHVNVLAERGVDVIPVTEAEITYVGVDMSTPDRKPVALGVSM